MTDNRTAELLYAVNADGIQAFCPFNDEASCGNWCPMLGREGHTWFCTLSVNAHGCGQMLTLVPRQKLPGRPRDWSDYA